MRLRALHLPVSSLLAFTIGCTSDLPAPDLYPVGDDSNEDGGQSDLQIECGELPRAAVDASFVFAPRVTGAEGTLRFAADDLPAGLAISESTGEINGVPAEDGELAFELTVTDGTGATASDTCTIDIRPALRVGLDLDVVPYCIRTGQRLDDFVVDGTGDGTPIRCEHVGSQGNGKIPDGIELDPETCTITGSVTEQRLGTWAFVVRGTQSGAEVWVPYCATREQGLGYTVRVEHSDAVDNTLVPLMRTYDPAAALAVGTEGDPRFEITHDSACSGSSCFYGYAFSVNSSPFDIDTISFNPRSLLEDPNTGSPIGFTHGFSIGGPAVSAGFRDRPWVVNFDLDYCLSTDADQCTCPTGDDTCNAAQRVRDNGDGNLEFSIIMVPE